eukprot:m51a1_g11178 hypothetical protein (123) ;mRNA; r:332104-332711
MRLITHNVLMCNKKGCTIEHFPLRIEATRVEQRQSEFNPEFVRHMIAKLDWAGLVAGAKDCGMAVPAEMPAEADQTEEFLHALHDVLLDLHVEEGALVCTHCNRRYPITEGIPNMLLTEDEL